MHDCSRRQFLLTVAASATAASIGGLRAARAQTLPATRPAPTTTDAGLPTTAGTTAPATPTIDRKAVIARHTVTLNAIDGATPLHVGNGDFAFGCDVTGLQTFADVYRSKVQLETIANWGWYQPPAAGPATSQRTTREYDVGNRKVGYEEGNDELAGEVTGEGKGAAGRAVAPRWRRASLARIALVGRAGEQLQLDEITNIEQTLDLWAGLVRSRFDAYDARVDVATVTHPLRSLVAFRINSDALARRDLSIRISFPGVGDSSDSPDEWDRPEIHHTTMRFVPSGLEFDRRQDGFEYAARLDWTSPKGATISQDGPHAFTLHPEAKTIDVVVDFAPMHADAHDAALPSFDDVQAAAAKHWETFWTDAAAIDFSACTDTRAPELERRVVLSQYLTAIHCAGTMPAPATGMAVNRSFGGAAMDQQIWSAGQFAMWGRFALLERSLSFYDTVAPAARETAKRQGYDGARWPRNCGPDGHEAVDHVGPFMIWQQPHPIYFAELAYRANPTRETLEKYGQLVDQTARFMASYARLEEPSGRYTLGPALVPAQENYAADRSRVINPTFELAYWVWGLTVAQKWRDRLGMPREELWDRVVQHMSKPTQRDGRYAAIEVEPFVINGGHPSFLMALGLLPKTYLIDENVMRETARWTRAKWKWNDATGVDFAMLAQTAARLGEAELAVDALLLESERNGYLVNGHNRVDADLPINLPANGTLLAAVAMMAGGWDGSTGDAPGFPRNGKWNVRCEGFESAI